MQNLFMPLTDIEMQRLEDFLLNRIDEDAVSEGKDEGILDISTLDGFMTALVSGPNVIPPSKWLPVIWGDFEPEWNNMDEFQDILSLLMRHMNNISGNLIEAPEEFEPIFMEREVKGKTYWIVDEWCDGYLRGMKLDSKGWSTTENIEPLLSSLLLFSSEAGWEKLEQMTDKEIEQQQNKIAPAVRRVHAWWLEHRANQSPAHRNNVKVGRNDLCPCGSGKKFKKCCGSEPTVH